ncbi:MAG: N-6 DNA methylase [Dehalococcoidia bacterium]
MSEDEGRRVGLSILEALGYNASLCRADYPVWLGEKRSGRADVVGFGRRPLDMTTATVVLEVGRDARALQNATTLAKALAAPVVILLNDEDILLHSISKDGVPFEQTRLKRDDHTRLAELSKSIGPAELLQAKLGHRQLGLFPVDVGLLDSARRQSERNLGPLVDAALETAAEMSRSTLFEVRGSEQGERLHKQAARIVVGALTALALRDKEDLQDLSPAALADTSQQRYAQYFRWLQDASPLEHQTLEAIIAALGDGIDYRSLDPRILASVYENSLVSDAHRKALGTHYTPSSLARLMLQTVPLEEVRPENRLVLDPTCGSGGLLLAAHDRLRDLHPQSMDPHEAHNETVAQLRGLDRDGFAVELARLSLLLNAYPAGNGWHIRQADVLATVLDEAEAPSVIVANPPWRNTNTAGARQELADRFLTWMVHALTDGGFLAIILPVGWLNNRNRRAARRNIQEHCDIFEVWRLPEQVFESSNMAPTVLFAQKRRADATRPTHRLMKRVLRPESLPRFYTTGRADETLLSSVKESTDSEITGGLLAEAIGRKDFGRLGGIADVVTGPQPRPGVAQGRHWSQEPPNARYLARASDLVHLGQPNASRLLDVCFPDDFQGGSRRGAAGLGRPKVLVSAARSAENPWRLRVGFDLVGILARNSMQMVIPLQPERLLGLTLFLASTFASAWIDETVPDRNISTSDIRSIPVPLAAQDWDDLALMGQRLLSVVNTRGRNDLLRAADDLIWRRSSVTDEVRQVIESRFRGFLAPDGVIRYPRSVKLEFGLDEDAPTPALARDTFGATLAVRDGEARIAIAGVTGEEGIWTQPPDGISGWMLRPGTTFNAELPTSDAIMNGKFSYQIGSWLADDELEAHAFGLFDTEEA